MDSQEIKRVQENGLRFYQVTEGETIIAKLPSVTTILGQTIDNTPVADLAACGTLVDFITRWNTNNKAPRDDLANGGTQYVLANPGESYIMYTSALAGDMGLKNMAAGTYDFEWLF